MSPAEYIEVLRELGFNWGPPAVAFLLVSLVIWVRWKRRYRKLTKLLLNWEVAATVVLCLVGLFLFYEYWGLPEAFSEDEIGILVAEVPNDPDRKQQQSYALEILSRIEKAPDLVEHVRVRLLERPLSTNDQHEEAKRIGRRLGATFVLRIIPVVGGHRVRLSIVDQPRLLQEETGLGRVTQAQLAEPEHLELPGDVALLARCVLALSLYREESYGPAAAHFQEVLEAAELAPGAPPKEDLHVLLGNARYRLGAYRKAAIAYRAALVLREDDPMILNNLGLALSASADYSEAEPLYQRALAISEKALGPDHPSTATSLNNLALLYKSQGQYEQAEPLYQRALGIREKALGPDHPSTATSLNNLAALYDSQGQYEQAEPLYQRALGIREKALGPDHPDTATSLNNLAALYDSQGQYEQAEPLYQRALGIKEKALGPDHPSTATSLNNLALLYKSQGQYEQAEPLYQRALGIREKALGPDHPSTATSLNNLAALYDSQGQYEQAEPLYQRALGIREKALGPDHPDTATSLNNLAALYDSQGQYEQAEPLYQRALGIKEKALGPDHPSTATSLNNLALLYKSQGQYEQAEPLYQRALGIREKALGPDHPDREKALGPDHPDTATSLNNLAALYDSQGQYEQAEPLYQRALGIKEKALGPDHPSTATSLNNLALLYKSQGQYEQAEPLYQRALGIREKALGPTASTTWRGFTRAKGSTSKPSRCTNAPSLSGKRRCRVIQTWPLVLRITPTCWDRWAVTTKRRR